MAFRRPSFRKFRLAGASVLVAGALAVAPTLAGTAQAETTPLYLWTTWSLYNYQYPNLFGQTNFLETDAVNLATNYSNCTGTCFYVIPSLPYGATGTKVFFAKMAWRGAVTETEGDDLASVLETTSGAGPTLLNSYYNWGSVGTVTKGTEVYAVLIMTHYTNTPPQN